MGHTTRTLGALLIAAVSVGAAFAQAPEAAATFDKVWTIVRDTHFDPAFDRATWDRARDEVRPKAGEGKMPGPSRAVLRAPHGRLALSRLAFIPAWPDSPHDRAGLSGQPGFDVRLIDRQ